MEDVFGPHTGTIVEIIGMIAAAIGIYTAIRVDLKVLHANHEANKEHVGELDKKLDAHVTNYDIHGHRVGNQ
jgi:uncharacterized membrane protein YdjX (TVP38/TMEM64 family)